MKKIAVMIALLVTGNMYAQEVAILLKQAGNYERTLKEDSAILKYNEVLTQQENNMQALIKLSLLTSAAAGRLADKEQQKQRYERAKSFAEKALALDSNNTDAIYAKGFADLKWSAVETDNKKIVLLIKEAKQYADKALAINPAHGKANFLLGKWHFDMVNVAWTKKAALKVLYGGMPDATIENAIAYMEKCRVSEPYFVQNFLELARAYKFNNNPSKGLEVLQQLVKLPNRTADDPQWKAEGKKMLEEMK